MIHLTSTALPEPTLRPPLRQKRLNVFTTAFTLIELLAVIAVMVMLLGFTMPIIRGGSGGVGKSSWDIAGVIEQAQAYAMAQNTYVWVGFNAKDVSSATEGTSQVVAFIFASKDGTSSPSDPNNVALIDKVHSFENVTLLSNSATGFGTADGYTALKPGSRETIAVDPGLANVTFDNNKLPTKVVSGTRKTLQNANNSVIEISPSGSISRPGISNPTQWLDFRLQSMRGTSPIKGDTALVEISALTGRATVSRPGDHNSAAE